jgi:SAM-dependent methyltransferase
VHLSLRGIVTQEFDKEYWETHWQQANAHGSEEGVFPNPHLARETGSLARGTALDAGCGEGAEAIWLATEGWEVSAVDISSEALAHAAERLRRFGLPSDHVQWIEADLSVWEPGTRFDLVTTQYAHPAMPQLEFYERISNWVAPQGTLLIIGHLEPQNVVGYGQASYAGKTPVEVTADAASISALFAGPKWDIITATEHSRTVTRGGGREAQLRDVAVRATRV